MAINMKLCQGKDVFERMNYLYQASHLVASRSNTIAASYYGNVMVGCAKKAVLRMEPDVKRMICKCCQTPLIPGETARVRLVSKPAKMVKWTCLTCKSIKMFSTKKGYKLWTQQPEAIIEIFDYTPKLSDTSVISDRNKNAVVNIDDTVSAVITGNNLVSNVEPKPDVKEFITEMQVSTDENVRKNSIAE